jgi:hypothetical protein
VLLHRGLELGGKEATSRVGASVRQASSGIEGQRCVVAVESGKPKLRRGQSTSGR